ncbi:MAG: 1-(5-phosphoribosyl)-5-[(5-phosphoribosylamino)methylideneamino] imidazole-4-carboxamide isomerase [Trueperaceae bacterium]|nr:1-(5-phosphoribosyl)-5-[(5-phosphoribosylamino)methylideneamino] imidazole-4-carboxamide isomerase [Trueperaceae bacterium]
MPDARPFVVYPCVDVQRGRAVRLTEGDPERETVYFEDPRAAAAHWVGLGARELHVVDLDAAIGSGDNRAVIREAAAAAALAGARVEVGGGVRSLEVARAWLQAVHRVVLGTVAVTDPDLVAALVAAYGADRVAVSVDARAGKVAVRGWTETSAVEATELAAAMAERGVRHLIYTDVSRDGTLQGVDPEPVRAVRAAFPHVLVAGGGVARDADLDLYAGLGLDGAIVGRALYEGTVRYPRAS